MEALDHALADRKPWPASLIHHSDRGQYASTDYRQRLAGHDITVSMSRPGNPYDNAKAESFMKTLKTEEVDGRRFKNIEHARRFISVFIDTIYNTERLHSQQTIASRTAFSMQNRRRGMLPKRRRPRSARPTPSEWGVTATRSSICQKPKAKLVDQQRVARKRMQKPPLDPDVADTAPSDSALEKTEALSALGPPKSASEGAERDRTWPRVVPQRNGMVESVDKTTITVIMDPNEERPTARRQTFQLRGKVAYVAPGDRFTAQASIIAGAPPRRVNIKSYLNDRYDPLADIDSQNAVDRYAAAKSLSYLLNKKEAVAAIDRRLDVEKEERVLLEAAGAGTALESQKAWDRLAAFVWKQERADLRMEAVFILTELRSPGARELLLKIASVPAFFDDEIRQAAVWGLGKAGVRQYADLVPFLGDADRDVVLHAIAAFDTEVEAPVIDQLISDLFSGDSRRAPAASEALRVIASDVAL